MTSARRQRVRNGALSVLLFLVAGCEHPLPDVSRRGVVAAIDGPMVRVCFDPGTDLAVGQQATVMRSVPVRHRSHQVHLQRVGQLQIAQDIDGPCAVAVVVDGSATVGDTLF